MKVLDRDGLRQVLDWFATRMNGVTMGATLSEAYRSSAIIGLLQDSDNPGSITRLEGTAPGAVHIAVWQDGELLGVTGNISTEGDIFGVIPDSMESLAATEGYTDWDGKEKWINPDTGKPWPGKVYTMLPFDMMVDGDISIEEYGMVLAGLSVFSFAANEFIQLATLLDMQTLTDMIDGKQGILQSSDDITISGNTIKISDKFKSKVQGILVDSDDVTIGEDRKLTVADSVKNGATTALIDAMWTDIGNAYVAVDHSHKNSLGNLSPYYANDIWMTQQEAINVLANGVVKYPYPSVSSVYEGRTNLFCRGNNSNPDLSFRHLFYARSNSSLLETVRIAPNNYAAEAAQPNNIDWFCGNATGLTLVLGILDMSRITTKPSYAFYGCSKLESIQIKNLKCDLDMSSCAALSVDSIVYMIQNSDKTVEKTITLHRTAYDRLFADETWGDNLVMLLQTSRTLLATE